MSVELLEIRGCDYADFDSSLSYSAELWREATGRKNLRNRKDWEFVTMVNFALLHAGQLKRVLDAACGTEPLVDWLASVSDEVIAADKWEPAYLRAAGIELESFLSHWQLLPNVKPVVMDSMRLDYLDNIFDASFCVSSIEHFGPEDGWHDGAFVAVSEMIRVTKPGGLIAFSTEVNPTAETDTWYFTAGGLARFLEHLTGGPPSRKYETPDGNDNKEGVYPVAIALKKL
jgi:SAM-dependent methyltransferase